MGLTRGGGAAALQECEGEVFAFDAATQSVVLREAPSGGAAGGVRTPLSTCACSTQSL